MAFPCSSKKMRVWLGMCLSTDIVFLFTRTALSDKEICFWYLNLSPWCILEWLHKSLYFQTVLISSSFTEETCITVLAQRFLKNQPTSKLCKQWFRTLNSPTAEFGKSWPFLSLEQCLRGDIPFPKWTNTRPAVLALPAQQLRRSSHPLFWSLLWFNWLIKIS